MSNERTRKRMIWTVVAVLVTGLAALLLMNLSAPEKKLEQTLPHRYSIGDPQFRREMSVMLGPAIIGGNRVVALQNGDEIFPAMLDAIREAKTSITFETYIYWSGEIGRKFTEALSERAQAFGQQIGIALLILLMGVALFNDVAFQIGPRLVSGQ